MFFMFLGFGALKLLWEFAFSQARRFNIEACYGVTELS